MCASQLWCLLPHWLHCIFVIVCRFLRCSSCNRCGFSVVALIRRLIVFCYLTDLPSLYIVVTTYSLLCRYYSGVYCYVPSLPILLSSPVTNSFLRLCHGCGDIAHLLFLQIVVFCYNIVSITLFTFSASHSKSSLELLLFPTAPCHYQWHYLLLNSLSKLPFLWHWIIGALRWRCWSGSGFLLSSFIFCSLSFLWRWIVCILHCLLATDLRWRLSRGSVNVISLSILATTGSFWWWCFGIRLCLPVTSVQ